MSEGRLQRTRENQPEMALATAPALMRQRPLSEAVKPGQIVMMSGGLPCCGRCGDIILGHPWVVYGHDGKVFDKECAEALNPIVFRKPATASPELDAVVPASAPATEPPAVLNPLQAAVEEKCIYLATSSVAGWPDV